MEQALTAATTTCKMKNYQEEALKYKLILASALTTAIDNGPNSISQSLKDLKTGTNYTFSAEAQVPYDSSEYCFVYVYMGNNATRGEIAQQELDMNKFGSWVTVSGSFVPKKSTAQLHVSAWCDSEDNSYTGLVWLDAISLVPQGGCGSS